MKMNGEHNLPVDRKTVWNALINPNVLKESIPGCTELEESKKNEFKAIVALKIGPVSEKFNSEVKLSDIDLYKSYIEKAKEENIGFVKVIDLELDMDSIKDKEDLYLCNGIHQYLEGNVYQANRINEIFWRSSSLTKID